jgi:hypothetical protein
MSHPLAGTPGRPIGKRWAAMQASRHGDEFHLLREHGLLILKEDALVAPLPDRYVVFDQAGEPVLPSPGKRFFITMESIDPFHAIAELE